MKKIRRWCLLFAIALLWNCCCVYAVPASDSCMTLDAKGSLAGNDQLLPTAQAVVLYAPDSDTIVYSWNPDVPLDPAGMNKIMTALLALERGNLDAVVSVSSTALKSIATGALTAKLKAGETMTLRDLLYLMMVGSANDAAAVIAEYIGGSQANFITAMNERAAELGCTNTVFLNPTGLSVEGQHSTARDLAKITAEALKLEDFKEIFSTVEYTVPGSEHKVTTTNHMMSSSVLREYLDSRVTGGKTGAASSADRSLIATAEADGLQLLSVVMGAKGNEVPRGSGVYTYANFTETTLLLDHAFSQYAQRQLLSANRVMTQFQVAGGENDLAVSSRQTVIALMPTDMKTERVTYQCMSNAEGLSAPVSAGDVVGTVQLWYDHMCVAQEDLIAMHDVKEKGTAAIALQPQAEVSNSVFKTLVVVCLLVLLAAAVLVVGIVIAIRTVRVKQYRKRRTSDRRRR